MYYFIQGHYELSGGHFELVDILSACQPFEFDRRGHFDGQVTGNRRVTPADCSMVSYWHDAIRKFREQGIPDSEALRKLNDN